MLWDIFLRSPVYGSGPDQYQFELTRRAMPHLIKAFGNLPTKDYTARVAREGLVLIEAEYGKFVF